MSANNQDIYNQLKSAGYTQQFNEALKAFLGSEGYTSALNEAMRDWLVNEGYTGSYINMLNDWAEAGYPGIVAGGTWILALGSWNDSGVWDDSDVWNDS